MAVLEKKKKQCCVCLEWVTKRSWNEHTNDCGNQNLVQDYCCPLIEVSNKQEGKPILCLGLCSVCVNLSLFSLLSDYLTYYCLGIRGVCYIFHRQVTSVTKNPPCWAAILCGRVCECECVCAHAHSNELHRALLLAFETNKQPGKSPLLLELTLFPRMQTGSASYRLEREEGARRGGTHYIYPKYACTHVSHAFLYLWLGTLWLVLHESPCFPCMHLLTTTLEKCATWTLLATAFVLPATQPEVLQQHKGGGGLKKKKKNVWTVTFGDTQLEAVIFRDQDVKWCDWPDS